MRSPEFALYALGIGAGQMALSPVPGRSGSYEADLLCLLHWGPDVVVSMTSHAEMDRVGADSFNADLTAVGIEWRHLPIVDFGVPDSAVAAQWGDVSARCTTVLANGGKILIQCFGGCGRSGMAALRLMVEMGEDPDAALTRLRQTRPCAVETDAQKTWAFSGV